MHMLVKPAGFYKFNFKDKHYNPRNMLGLPLKRLVKDSVEDKYVASTPTCYTQDLTCTDCNMTG